MHEREHTFLADSLPDSHSNTSKGERFLWTVIALDVVVELLNVGAVEASEGPLMLRETIWWEDANAPTVHEKRSEDWKLMLSLTFPAIEMRTSENKEDSWTGKNPTIYGLEKMNGAAKKQLQNGRNSYRKKIQILWKNRENLIFHLWQLIWCTWTFELMKESAWSRARFRGNES